jgi:hypothetical protein
MTTQADLQQLLLLRTAKIRCVPSLPIEVEAASRLHSDGLAQSDGAGGVEITDEGIRLLESHFTFCEAVGCDGVLRRWQLLSPIHAGHDSRDAHIGQPTAECENRYYLPCPKCGALNLLGEEAPTMRSHYVVRKVIAG